jgi:hypothetical protein
MSEQLPHSTPPAQVHDEPVPRPLQWLKDNSLPVIGLLLLVLLFYLAAHYSSIQIDWVVTHNFTGASGTLFRYLLLCWWLVGLF